jgi:hypothetical protein
LGVVVVATLAVLAGAASPAVADTTITFDSLANGTVVTDQFRDQGIRFARPLEGQTGQPWEVATVTQPRVIEPVKVAGQTVCTQNEFCATQPNNSYLNAAFTKLRRQVSVRVRSMRNNQRMRVRIYGPANRTSGIVLLDSQDVESDSLGGFGEASFTRTFYDIAFVQIASLESGGDKGVQDGIAVRSITFDDGDPAATPDFAVSIAGLEQQGTFPVRAGTERTFTVDVMPLNGSQGQFTYTISTGAKMGASIAPGPGDEQATATIKMPTEATSATVSVRVTVTPKTSASGQGPRSVDVAVRSLRAFGITATAPIRLDACGNGATTVNVHVPEGLAAPASPRPTSGSVRLQSASPQEAGELAIDPASVPWPDPFGGSNATVRVTRRAPDATGPVTVKASAGDYLPAYVDIPAQTVRPKVTGSHTTAGRAPFGLQPGTLVTFLGSDLCAGVKLYFGNPLAVAEPETIAPDGTSMTVRVPRLATSGPVMFASPGESSPTQRKSSIAIGRFEVNHYRAREGFAFPNSHLENLEFEQATALMGKDKLYLKTCVPATSVCWTSPIADPTALAWFFAVDTALSGDEGDAYCFGMSLLTQRLMRGEFPIAELNPSAKSTYDIDRSWGELPTPGNVKTKNAKLEFTMGSQHIAQLSKEFVELAFKKLTTSRNPGSIRAEIQAALSQGRYPLVSMVKGFAGHTVVAYDIEETTDPGVQFYLRTYDPNQPYAVSGNEAKDGVFDPLSTSLGGQHERAERMSRIAIRAEGWEFQGFNSVWSGPHGKLLITPVNEFPVRPSPLSLGSAVGLTTFGTSAEVVSSSDASGPLASPRGGRPRAVPWVNLNGTSAPRATHIVDDSAPFRQVVKGSGRYTGSYVMDGFTVSAENMAGGGQDTFDFDPRGRSAAVGTSGAPKKLTLRLAARQGGARAAQGGGREVRTAAVTTTTGKTPSELSLAGGRVAYTHRGPATKMSLEIGWVGPRGVPGTVRTAAIAVRDGDRLRVTPQRWTDLATSRATLELRRGRRTTRRTIRTRAARAALASGLNVKATGRPGRPAKLEIGLRQNRLPSGSSVGGGVRILRGGRTVARYPINAEAVPAAGRRTLLKRAGRKLARGTYRVEAVVVVSRGGRSPVTQRLRKVRTLRVR